MQFFSVLNKPRTNGEETTDSIISKMLSNVSCLVFDRSSVIKKSNTSFDERAENRNILYCV
jgi:hypothetical protein